MINRIEKVYLLLSLGEQWWSKTYLNILLQNLKEKENRILTLEEIETSILGYLNIKQIDHQSLVLILTTNSNIFEKKDEGLFLMKEISEEAKKEIQDTVYYSNFQIANIKNKLTDILKMYIDRKDVADAFFYLVIYPVLKKAVFQLFKGKFDILDKANKDYNITPSIKKFYQIFPKIRKEIQLDSLLKTSIIDIGFIGKIILSILFIELISYRLDTDIDLAFFSSEEFRLFIDTHFLLSLEVINSAVLLEEHFNNSAESISKILVNDSYKKGNLYNEYLKVKWNSIQEKYDDKLSELFTKKEQEFWDIVNDSKDILDKSKDSIREFETRQGSILFDAEQKIIELNQKNRIELNEYIYKSDNILSNIKQENELQKGEINKSVKNNEAFYESVIKQIETLLNKIESIKENTNSQILIQSETFKTADYKRKEKELKAFDEDIQKQKDSLNRKLNRKKKDKTAKEEIDKAYSESKKLKIKTIVNSILSLILPIGWGIIYLCDVIKNLNSYYIYPLLFLEFIIIFNLYRASKSYISKRNEAEQMQKENKNNQKPLWEIELEIERIKEEIDEIDDKFSSRRQEILDAINEIRTSVGKKQDINAVMNYGTMGDTNMGSNNKIQGDTMNDSINVGGNAGNINAGSGKQKVTGNVAINQNATDKEKEEQYLKALAELREEISKITASGTEAKEMEKAIQKIEEEVQSGEPDLDVVEAKSKKLVTIAERVEQAGEGVDQTSNVIDKVHNLLNRLILFVPELTEIIKPIFPI